MKKILIAINSASHQIFQNDIISLTEGYKKIIEKNNLNIDVITFCGKAENKDSYIEDIVLDTPEKEVGKIVFDAIERQLKLEKYDVIVKANTNTVVNLTLIQEYCDSPYFNENFLYTCAGFFTKGRTELRFPAGMFLMGSSKLWKSIISSKKEILEYANQFYNDEGTNGIFYTEDDIENLLMWTGYSDEFLIGVGIKLNSNLHIYFINSSTCSKSKCELFPGIPTMMCELLATINCKLDYSDISLKTNSFEEKFRIQYEHHFIDAICKIFELYRFEKEDLEHITKLYI